MQQQELEVLIGHAAVLMEQFERRCENIERHLHSLGQQLPAIIKQSADGSLQSLPSQVMGQVRDGLERPVQDYQQRLRTAGSEVGAEVSALAQQLKRMEQLHRMLIWKVIGVSAMSLLLLLGGGAWLAMHYADVIKQNQMSADLVSVYNHADVTICDGHLCANVDPKGKRYGEHGEYLSVKAR
ncbi:relaxation protein [Dyella sp. GSA-30]|uniref:relaxation protein n=1 Tax=Dyella sp. GSA-30 TaxID=2994496 RepID=UPI0024934037|nr:relaxation protein [Dyella sp. GSA-30]BDU19257.1 hypothetical protein DYGSA30_07140 [Dyella sp. GSA-30]